MAKAATPPAWSLCSCVTRIAPSEAISTSARASRRSSSRGENPSSISTRVAPELSDASTTYALPRLPEPRQQKRSTQVFKGGAQQLFNGPLLHLLVELLQDPVAGRLNSSHVEISYAV